VQRKYSKILKTLEKAYPDAKCALNHKTPLQLLVATILSAQCTDVRVNLVTKDLFKKYKTPSDYADAPKGELEEAIRSTGFFNNKAKSIRKTCGRIRDNFSNKIPKTMDELLTLSGVARKTANVVMGNAFKIASGIVVDTHVSRISQRLGLTDQKKPDKIEEDLKKIVPIKKWIIFSHQVISHGRKICKAKKPECRTCPLSKLCPSCDITS